MLLEKETSVALQAAEQAAQIVRQVYATPFEVQYKSGDEPVTKADRLANDWIVKHLSKEFPNDGIVAEESVSAGRELELQVLRERVWFVDPVDGTQEFANRIGEFSVMIGLAVHGRPVLGVVAIVQRREIAVGVVGQGAWLLHADATRTDMHVSSKTSINSCILTMSRSHVSQRLLQAVDAIAPGHQLRSGSVGIKAALIACQQADIDVHINEPIGAKLWDGCAPEAIVLAAGGMSSNVFGNAINYSTTRLPLTHGLVLSNGIVHQQVIERLREVVHMPST